MTNFHRGESESIWTINEWDLSYPRLVENLETDVCIVGGGLAGLTTAYLLARESKKVCLIEDGLLGSGQSGKSRGFFTVSLDCSYSVLEKMHGAAGAYLAADSHRHALEFVEKVVLEEKIDCELEKVPVFDFGFSNAANLSENLQVLHRAGLLGVTVESELQVGDEQMGSSLRYPDQIQLNPLKYIKGLAEAIVKHGGKIFSHSHVQEIVTGAHPMARTRDGYQVKAKSIVVATHSPINNLFAIHMKQFPYRNYVLAFSQPNGSISRGLYRDRASGHCIQAESDGVVLVSGQEHKTGQHADSENKFKELEEWSRAKIPVLREVIQKWSTQEMRSIDGLAYLGRAHHDNQNIFIITGDSGNGTTHSTIGALIISDLINERKNPWTEIYDPARINLRVTGEFVKGNMDTLAQYAKWFKGKDFESIKLLKRDEGMVLKQGLDKFAAYKDDTGRVFLFSGVCTHLGCIVSWNNFEKTWDCPCHGSRYDKKGKVIEGPAKRDLKEIKTIDSDDSEEGLIRISEEKIPDQFAESLLV